MKKILKIFGIVILVLLIALISAPFLFRGSLERLLLKTINENVNATVNWENLDLSLFRNFPDASLKLNNFSVINKAPFEGDTLVSGTVNLEMGIMQLFKTKDLQLDAFHLDNAFVNIKVDSTGAANYDIMLEQKEALTSSEVTDEESFTLNLKNYSIKNSNIQYLDESSKILFMLTNFEHRGTGDLSETVTRLDTHSETLISLRMDETEYLSNHRLLLDAVLEINLETMRFSFMENEARINELPLVFDGYFQMFDSHNEIDLSFKTPSSDFKNFLALIPKEYVKQIENVRTTGDFSVTGVIEGIIDETHIPKMDIHVKSNNASFKYPDLPMAVENIIIDAQLKNETGLMKDMFLNIPNLTFTIDGAPFRMAANVKNMTENAQVAMEMEGTVNLSNLDKILPMEMEQKPEGIFEADFSANFDMESIDKERYDRIHAEGNAKLSKFQYDSGFKSPLKIEQASVSMNPNLIQLKELQASIGETDFNANGTLHNLFSFLMTKQNLKGIFSLSSNTFNVGDFMVAESETKKTTLQQDPERQQLSTQPESIKIPDFLEADFTFNANQVIYDNLVLKNARGNATIKDETINIQNFRSDIFGGNIAFSGNVSTKEATPTFGVNLDLNQIDIVQSFREMELFQFLAPIAQSLQGNINTKFQLNGNLDRELSPVLSTLSGNADAEIISASVDPDKTPFVSRLQDNISFLDWKGINLRNITTNLTFNNGNIEVKPFDFDVKGIQTSVSGVHGLDKSINYQMNMDVPAEYLGNEVNRLLSDLGSEANDMKINIPVKITGTFNQPQVSLDLNSAVREITDKIVAKQKDKLIDKGKDIIGDIINKNIPQDTTRRSTLPITPPKSTDSVIKNVEDKAKDLLDGILKGRNRN